jgi:hypothetical protein
MVWIISIYNSNISQNRLIAFPRIDIQCRCRKLNCFLAHITSLLKQLSFHVCLIILVLYKTRWKLQAKRRNWRAIICNNNNLCWLIFILYDWNHLNAVCNKVFFRCSSIDRLIVWNYIISNRISNIIHTQPFSSKSWFNFDNFALHMLLLTLMLFHIY